ncbi:MAG: O-antigen ligase family protein [Bacteroides sp.]|nr:O-antigen ligase family protein [Bacteroides sp.]
MKPLWNHLINILLIVPFIMVLSTVFVINRELANGVVSGKYFWFYLSILAVSVTVLLSWGINRKKISLSLPDLFIILFCISGVVIPHYHHGAVTHKVVLLLLVLILYFYFRIFLLQYKWNRVVLLAFFIGTGLVESIWGLSQIYGFTASQHTLFKTTGSFFNPGPYAGYVALTLPPAFYYLLSDYRVLKGSFRCRFLPYYIRWGLSALSCTGALLILPSTLSRASWFAALAGCAVVGVCYLWGRTEFSRHKQNLLTYSKKRLFTRALPVLVLGVATVAGVYYLKKDSADGRALIWKISAGVIKEYPLGVGIGHFPGVYGDKQAEYFLLKQGSPQQQLVAGNPEYAFNEYMQICIEFGILPFLLFLLFIGSVLYRGIRHKRYAATGALVSLLVFAAMSYPFSILPFLIAGVFLAALCTSFGKTPATGRDLLKGGIALFLLLLITQVAIYNRLPQYDAYKKWKKVKVLYSAGLHKEAAREYEELYPCLEHEISFLFEYAQALSKLEEYSRSNEVLESAVKISCDPMLYNVMGKNRQALKKYEEAEQSFLKASLIVPNRLYPYYLLARLYDETEDAAKVCEMAEILHFKEPKVPSEAVYEMRREVRSMCEKYKNK